MSDTMKIHLGKTANLLVIMCTLCSVIGAAYISYDNAKIAKSEVYVLKDKVAAMELNYANFKGVMEERTRNMEKNIQAIYDIVKEWQPEEKLDTKGLP